MEVNIKTKYINEDVRLDFGRYGNGSIAIQGYSLSGEPMFVATVALDDVPPDGHVYLKGWSENEGIPEALHQAGVVKKVGTKKVGYVTAIVAELLVDIEKV